MTNFYNLIIQHEEKNEMTVYNMSVVFAPCLLRSREATLEDL